MVVWKWSRLSKTEKIKVVLDLVFVGGLIFLPFLRIVAQFGYIEVYIYYYVVQDSIPELGFAIAKEGSQCLDVVFLSNCEFFTRIYVSSWIFAVFHLASLIFAVVSLVSILVDWQNRSKVFSSWWTHFMHPLFFIGGFSVLVFYRRLFDDEVVGVEGKFNLRYLEGTLLVWGLIANSLLSIGIYSYNERTLEDTRVSLLPT